MDKLTFTSGNKPEALSIMREAALWLIDENKPMWRLEDLTEDANQNPASDYSVAWLDGESIGAFSLSFNKDFVWSSYDNSAGYIHKISIRRKFAGKGYSEKLIQYATAICRQHNTKYLRLDCDLHRKPLRTLYENIGFNFVDVKTFDTMRHGIIDCALYQLSL